MWISDIAHSRELDRRSIEEFGLPGMVLMERAGLAVFEALQELLPDRGRIAVLCGKGNNGGDGFVLARLAHQHGYEVGCLAAANEEDLQPDAKQEMLQARAQGVSPIFAENGRWRAKLERLSGQELIVDALLGIGATGHVTGPIAEAIDAINRSGVPVLSVDVPSGIHADTGEELGESVWAIRTVTMGQPKPYLFQGIGLEHSGHWSVGDIGLPRELLKEPTGALLIDLAWAANLIPERLKSSHKGSNGHVLVVAGSHSMRGAAVLAAKAALRAGAGVVTLAGIESVCEAVMSHCPEAILMPMPEKDGVIAPEGSAMILERQARFSSALFGPGMTHSETAREFLGRVWSRWETPSCIDADALNAVGLGLALPPCECVLTPHPGELSRLMQTTAAEVQADRFRSVRSAVSRYGKTVLLKGPYSVVGSADEPLLVNPTGNAGMAAAGMGDVLGGMIAALLAQDLPPYFAAAAGAFWHGLAGDICAQEIGPVGFVAREVSMAIPKARAKLAEACAEA